MVLRPMLVGANPRLSSSARSALIVTGVPPTEQCHWLQRHRRPPEWNYFPLPSSEAGGQPLAANIVRSSDRLSLVDQHDRYVILDRIEQLACFTNQAVPRLGQSDRPFALGTGKDIEQILTNCHLTHLF